ncbi:hypothetical protein [Methylorubrum extorquens]|uniref:hypothetical protein n=1 Tax=Methylorubrum extorquens TaxID=408 RepID=UPI001EE530A9|nr:hypothetical protein [Methylorubrum extorquens]MCG5249613.1 hypothetical protein [Methylorubrum extorquens]
MVAATVLHIVRPDDLTQPHIIHIFGPKTKSAFDKVLECITANVEHCDIAGIPKDYVRLSVPDYEEARKLNVMQYLKFFDDGGHYIIKRYDEDGLQSDYDT